MQRLTDRLRRLRATADRGASAVLVGLLAIPLFAVAALAIDIAAMHADKQILQTGADAAALAVAQDCARNECTGTDATAEEMADANTPFGGEATATIVTLDEAAGVVTVRTDSSRNHFFAPVIGQDEGDIAASATAQWGYPTTGSGMLPYIMSYCEVLHQTGATPIVEDGEVVGIDFPEDADPVTFTFSDPKAPKDSGCTGPAGAHMPGGFGWLEATADCTGPVGDVGDWVPSDPGESPPNTCDPSDFEALIGETILVPIFDAASEAGGSHGEYRIFGFAAFTLLEYKLTGQYKTDGSGNLCNGLEKGSGSSLRCIHGTFDRFVDVSGDFDLGTDGPQLGAAVVELTLTED
ncbi:pilus assembly protein TadG-related protein [Isoptericola sp. AK164]|uniref:TadE/TadG family type IV pilus assembly protein n=1 Tax=Isoptericola sp. AK164 TaxID=3024246 RepID=UPI002418836F|nr:pilus assembly protein TadG-related protein [Isoptericola sp. AK164]